MNLSGLVLGFCFIAIIMLARRMNRDEDIIVDLRNRVKELEASCGMKGETENES